MYTWSSNRNLYIILSLVHIWLFLMTGYVAYAVAGIAYAVLAFKK